MVENLNDVNFEDEIKKGIVLVDFGANWCPPCRAVTPIIEKIAEEAVGFKVVKVDIDESPKTSMKYMIKSVPTFLVFKKGNLVKKEIGAILQKQFFLDLVKDFI